MCVRTTNSKVVCQIIYPTIAGDKVVCQALSTELPRYGIKAGLTNFAATYATGLLVARRLLKQLDLEEAFEGVEECDGLNKKSRKIIKMVQKRHSKRV